MMFADRAVLFLTVFYFVLCQDLQLSCVSRRKTVFGRSLIHIETPNPDATKCRTFSGCECMLDWEYQGYRHNSCLMINSTTGWCFAFHGSCKEPSAGAINAQQQWDWCNCAKATTELPTKEDVNFCTDRNDWACQKQSESRECFYFDPFKELNLQKV